MKKVFIDGSAGTTGLQIRERLACRDDLELIILSETQRKDVAARREALNAADVAFLCLPDAAAIESVSLLENSRTIVIDTSTAHRTAEDWVYGFAELDAGAQRGRIAVAKRIANPGCHASGFIALIEPLVRTGIVSPDEKLCAFSLTGFSGGGKKMIADYEVQLKSESSNLYLGGRQYALGQAHKHLPEMVKVCGLKWAPCFSPIVVPHYSGMETTVQLFGKSVAQLKACYRSYYAEGGLVHFKEDPSEGGILSSAALMGRDDMEISVYGTDDRALVVARFDNLGKGASGAAIQNMNIALGCDEKKGLK